MNPKSFCKMSKACRDSSRSGSVLGPENPVSMLSQKEPKNSMSAVPPTSHTTGRPITE